MFKKRIPVIALCMLSIVLMASTAGMTYKHVEYMSNSKEQYNELEERYESVLEKMRQLQIDNGKLTNEHNELQYENAKLTEDNTILSDGLDDTLNTTMFFINSVGFVVHGHEGILRKYIRSKTSLLLGGRRFVGIIGITNKKPPPVPGTVKR